VNAVSMSDGGGRSYVTNLLREFAKDDRGFDFTFLCLPRQLDGLDTSGVALEHLRLPGALGRARVPLRVLYEEIGLPWLARRFDLLYCIADISPAIASTPTVVLLRNLNIYDRRYYDDRRTRTLARLAGWGARRAQKIVFPSRAAADLIRSQLRIHEARIAVVHYGIDLSVFDDRDAPKPKAGYLFLPAALERHKNIETAIRALPLVEDSGLELWLAGHSLHDPLHREHLTALAAQCGVRDRVKTLGPVPYAELLGYYRGARALVFPSFIETFGHPVLEAMASGTPLVLSDIATFRDLAGETALYVDPSDAAGLARCVDRVMQDREATERRVADGHVRVQKFSWRESVDSLCRVFAEVLRA
jgi:glycosyltransferase involved in cell wall biosynthesis